MPFLLAARFGNETIPEVLPNGPIFLQVDLNSNLAPLSSVTNWIPVIAMFVRQRQDTALCFSFTSWRSSPPEKLALLAYDVDEISDREVDVNQVQAPIGLDLAADDYIARNVINARIGRIAMHRDCEIRAFFIGNALGGQQAGNADKGVVTGWGGVTQGFGSTDAPLTMLPPDDK